MPDAEGTAGYRRRRRQSQLAVATRNVQGGAAWGLQGQLQLQRPVQNGMEKQAEGVRKIYERGFGCVVKQSVHVEASMRVSD